MEFAVQSLWESWALVVRSAPYLLAGFIAAGMIHAFVPASRLSRWLGGESWRSVVNASLIGVPLPLCSCAVVPVAAALRRAGASRGATTSFLVSTPESGADSIAATYALMDPVMTVVRPVAAFITALSAGLAVNLWGAPSARRESGTPATTRTPPSLVSQTAAGAPACCAGPVVQSVPCSSEPAPAFAAPARSDATLAAAASSCCSEPTAMAVASPGYGPEPAPAAMRTLLTLAPQQVAAASAPAGCCSDASGTAAAGAAPPAAPPGLLARFAGGLRYGLLDMFEDMGRYLVVGFLLAGVLAVALGAMDPLRAALSSPWAPLIMLAAGIPTYVCAAAATPIVAVLIAQGLSPGAGLVFLLAGPATNAATLVLVRQIIGTRAVVIYVLCIAACALALGYAVGGVYSVLGVTPAARIADDCHVHDASAGSLVAGATLTALVLYGVLRRFMRRAATATAAATAT